ncbi:MAG: sensor domain-containing diguanylate cyclase [Micrococcales bacterium]|nr:sensor domain-containing diguanylate cyclase [Micrococcales bacterium]
MVLQVSRDGRLEWASPSVADTFGWNRDEVVGRSISDFIPHGDWGNVADALASSASDGSATGGQFRVRRRGGRLIWVDATASSVRDPHGNLVRVVRLRDVDARVRARIALQNSEERFRAAMRATPIGVAIINRDGYIVQVNAALSRMLRRSEQSLMGNRITSLTHPEDRRIDLEMWNWLHGRQAGSVTREKRLMDSDGEALWVQNALASVRDEDGEIRPSWPSSWMSARPSRPMRRWNSWPCTTPDEPQEPARGARPVAVRASHPPRTGSCLGVLYCDLDRFKKVNDVHGHAVGDALLVEVARRMEAAVRDSDTVGRIGGDEFVVLLTQIRDEDALFAVAQKIRATVSEPFTADGVTLTPTLSIGAALADPGDSPDAVVAKADMALYAAGSRAATVPCRTPRSWAEAGRSAPQPAPDRARHTLDHGAGLPGGPARLDEHGLLVGVQVREVLNLLAQLLHLAGGVPPLFGVQVREALSLLPQLLVLVCGVSPPAAVRSALSKMSTSAGSQPANPCRRGSTD